MLTGKAPDRTAPPPLSRNRNYAILWSGQLLSELAAEVAAVAFPLLILSRAHSGLQLGIAAAAMAAASMLAVVPAGVLADRLERRRLMLVSQAGRVAAASSLALGLALGHHSFTHLMVVAVLEGLLASVFDPVEHAALPQVVPPSQLSTALARNTARPFLATLIGPALAGALFAARPAYPFALCASVLAVSAVTLVFLRLPPREAAADATSEGAPARPPTLRADAVAGLRWAFGNRVIRATLLWVAVTNLVFGGLLVVILATAAAAGVGASEIGLMMAVFGLGGLLGAALAPRLCELVPAPAVVLGFSWCAAAATAVMAFVPAGLPLGLLLAVAAFLAPAANTTVLTHQMVITPDRLRGRMSAVAAFCSGGAGVLGPLAGGVLVAVLHGGRPALLLCAAALSLVAAATTGSPTLRRFPSRAGSGPDETDN